MVLIRYRPEVTFWEGTLHPQVLSFSRSVIIPLQHTFDLITHILIFWETVFIDEACFFYCLPVLLFDWTLLYVLLDFFLLRV